MPAKRKNEWKPVRQYADLDGVEDRLRNRAAFEQFVKDFGWKFYVFHPDVYAYEKFFRNDPMGEKKDRNAVGFKRLPDRSMDEFGGHVRSFRNDFDTMTACIVASYDRNFLDKWCDRHGVECVVCHPGRSFHRNGSHIMLLFMSREARVKYGPVLANYPNKPNGLDDVTSGGTSHVEWK